MRVHYSGLIARTIARLVNGDRPFSFYGAAADEHQQNGAYGVHQLRLRLSEDPTVYRVLIAPADAPITIGGIPADRHFSHPIGCMPTDRADAGTEPQKVGELYSLLPALKPQKEKPLMRQVKDHIVENDAANHQLNIDVEDEPGAGGANHRYSITGFDTKTNPSKEDANGYAASFSRQVVLFQNGPINEAGVNGVTQEVLLAIVIDRLRSFQAGPYSCRENDFALTHCEDALMWLRRRTRARIARGVEGTHQK